MTMEIKPVRQANAKGSGPGRRERVKEETKTATFRWPESFSTRLKLAATHRGMSVAAFVQTTMTPFVDEAIKEFVEENVEDRR